MTTRSITAALALLVAIVACSSPSVELGSSSKSGGPEEVPERLEPTDPSGVERDDTVPPEDVGPPPSIVENYVALGMPEERAQAIDELSVCPNPEVIDLPGPSTVFTSPELWVELSAEQVLDIATEDDPDADDPDVDIVRLTGLADDTPVRAVAETWARFKQVARDDDARRFFVDLNEPNDRLGEPTRFAGMHVVEYDDGYVGFVGVCADGLTRFVRGYAQASGRQDAEVFEELRTDPSVERLESMEQELSQEPLSWDETTPDERLVDMHQTPPDIFDRMEVRTVQVSLPDREWQDLPIAVCSRTELGWNSCVNPAVAGDYEAFEMEVRFERGSPVTFVIAPADGTFGADLGELGTFAAAELEAVNDAPGPVLEIVTPGAELQDAVAADGTALRSLRASEASMGVGGEWTLPTATDRPG